MIELIDNGKDGLFLFNGKEYRYESHNLLKEVADFMPMVEVMRWDGMYQHHRDAEVEDVTDEDIILYLMNRRSEWKEEIE